MALKSLLVSFVLHLGIMLPVITASRVHILADETVDLPCPDSITKMQKPSKVVWKHNGTPIIQYTHGVTFKDDKDAKYSFKDPEKGNFSLRLPDGKEGRYICEVEGKQAFIYDLQLWNAKGPQSRYLLEGDTVLLEVTSSGKEHPATSIEWRSPQGVKVTDNDPYWKLENNNWRLQIKNLTAQKDNGIWECHILPNGPHIPYVVKVIGFLNALDGNDMKFAAVNSSVAFSCPLNINISVEKNKENFPELQSWELRKDNKLIVKKNLSINANSIFPAKELSQVQLEDAGKYICRYTFAKGHLDKFINLTVLKASTSTPEHHSEKMNVTLCCHISAPAPFMVELCWVHANKTRCQFHLHKSKFCQEKATAGFWRCDLKVDNNVKISINYTVEIKANGNYTLPLVEIISGTSVLLLLLIFAGLCVCALKTIKQKRHRARRMAQAKQHLLAKKTCQCERELTNDYYHA